eukprot:191443-Chlamydomonas_euryale.AAC.10
MSQSQSQNYRKRIDEGYACVERRKTEKGTKQPARRCHQSHGLQQTPLCPPWQAEHPHFQYALSAQGLFNASGPVVQMSITKHALQTILCLLGSIASSTTFQCDLTSDIFFKESLSLCGHG